MSMIVFGDCDACIVEHRKIGIGGNPSADPLLASVGAINQTHYSIRAEKALIYL